MTGADSTPLTVALSRGVITSRVLVQVFKNQHAGMRPGVHAVCRIDRCADPLCIKTYRPRGYVPRHYRPTT